MIMGAVNGLAALVVYLYVGVPLFHKNVKVLHLYVHRGAPPLHLRFGVGEVPDAAEQVKHLLSGYVTSAVR